MSPNWLSAIGQATPAIRQTMQDIQERPKQEARWGWEQERVGQEREMFGRRKALGDLQINALKYEDEQRKKQEEFDKGFYDPEYDPAFVNMPKENKDKIISSIKASGIPLKTQGDRRRMLEIIKGSPDLIKTVGSGIEFNLKTVANDALEALQKAQSTPGTPPDKIAKLLDAYNGAVNAYQGAKGEHDKVNRAVGFKLSHEKLMNSPEFKALPWEKQQVIDKAAISVLQGADPKEYADAVKETLFPKPTEKTANIHYSTDDKGNTIKIVSEPVTGRTISRENMGKIGKGKETKEAEKLTMTDVKSAYSMDIGNIKNQMMVDMTPDEQMNLAGQPDVNILALLLSGRVGKSLSPEKKKYYTDKLQEAEKYYGDLTNQVLGRKGAKVPLKSPVVVEPEKTSPNVQKLHDQAMEAIKMQPKRKEEIKKQYKEMTGREYK